MITGGRPPHTGRHQTMPGNRGQPETTASELVDAAPFRPSSAVTGDWQENRERRQPPR